MTAKRRRRSRKKQRMYPCDGFYTQLCGDLRTRVFFQCHDKHPSCSCAVDALRYIEAKEVVRPSGTPRLGWVVYNMSSGKPLNRMPWDPIED